MGIVIILGGAGFCPSTVCDRSQERWGFFLCWGWRLFCCHQNIRVIVPIPLGGNPSEADPIALGALGAWTIFEPDLLVALVAANWDFRKNFEAPVQDRPVKSNEKTDF